MKEFSATLKTPLALYWDSYLEMVYLMLCFILASRQGCWSLHLSAFVTCCHGSRHMIERIMQDMAHFVEVKW